MIALKNIYKSFTGRRIINGLNLEVKRGENLVIIGGSGTGKSVTLKLLMGVFPPDSGSVHIDGQPVLVNDPKSLIRARSKMGVLFQGAALLASLDIFENIALPLREHTTLTDAEIHLKVMDTLELVDLASSATKYPSEISGGMAKRAGLARAIVRDPEILLYDEPTSGLDPVMSHVIDALTRSLQRKLGVTSIIVTHDMTSAYRIADRIAYLYAGEVEEVGTPDEIKASTNKRLNQFVNGELHGPLTLKEPEPDE